MSTDYYSTTEAKRTTRFLTAAIAFCVVGIVAIAAVAGFALGGHSSTHHSAAAPANTSGIIIPAVPVTPTPSHRLNCQRANADSRRLAAPAPVRISVAS